MKSSKKDKWLDRIISRAAAADKNRPVPDFDKWQKEHPDTVQRLKSQADQTRSRSLRSHKHVSHEPLMLGLPRLAWACGIAALFLIATSCTVCIILARENRILRQDLQLARQEIAMNNRQRQIVEAQNNQQQAISELHVRIKELEQHVRRGISPRMFWYSESPYYIPERLGEL